MNNGFKEIARRYRGTTVLVFGGSGFIGRWVAKKLSDAGADVFITARDVITASRVLDSYGIDATILETDLYRTGAATDVVATVRPDVTFNLVGYGVDPEERDHARALRINSELVSEICHAITVTGPRPNGWTGVSLVHAGSALEYGIVSGDLDETTDPKPTTIYGETKLAGTGAVREASERTGLTALTARLFTVYGPGEHRGRLLPTLIEAAISMNGSGPLELTEGLQQRDFTYVEDVAEGLIRLALAEGIRGEAINLATGRLTSVREFVEKASRVLGIKKSVLRFGALPTRASEMSHDPVSIERLKGLTNWTPGMTIEDGVKHTMKFISVVDKKAGD